MTTKKRGWGFLTQVTFASPGAQKNWTCHPPYCTWFLQGGVLQWCLSVHNLAMDVYLLVYIMTRFVYMSKAPVVSIFLRCWFMCQRLLWFIINAVGLYAKDSCDLYWCGMGLSQEPLSDLLRLGNLVMFLFHGIQFPTDHSSDLVLV